MLYVKHNHLIKQKHAFVEHDIQEASGVSDKGPVDLVRGTKIKLGNSLSNLLVQERSGH